MSKRLNMLTESKCIKDLILHELDSSPSVPQDNPCFIFKDQKNNLPPPLAPRKSFFVPHSKPQD